MIGNSFVEVARFAFCLTGITDFASISVIRIDATKWSAFGTAAFCSVNAINDNVSWSTVAIAVATGADQLSVVFDIHILYGDRAFPIELEDFVVSSLCSSSNDIRSSTGLLESGGILADLEPPNIFNSAAGRILADLLDEWNEEKLTRYHGNEYLRLEKHR